MDASVGGREIRGARSDRGRVLLHTTDVLSDPLQLARQLLLELLLLLLLALRALGRW